MSRRIEYLNADDEKKIISGVQDISSNGAFYRVKYEFNSILLDEPKDKTKNIRKERVISYDE